MIKIYNFSNSHSSRKAKDWLNKHNIPFIEKNIGHQMLTKKEIKNILEKTENGAEDIISKRSKVIAENNIDLDSMLFNELIEFIQKNPRVMKSPIIIEGNKLQIGYNEEEIRMFIPHKLR